MAFEVVDRDALKRMRKLLTALDNSTVKFPVTIYSCPEEAAAFTDGSDREFKATTERGKPYIRMSDDPKQRQKWDDRERAAADEAIAELSKLVDKVDSPVQLIIQDGVRIIIATVDGKSDT